MTASHLRLNIRAEDGIRTSTSRKHQDKFPRTKTKRQETHQLTEWESDQHFQERKSCHLKLSSHYLDDQKVSNLINMLIEFVMN